MSSDWKMIGKEGLQFFGKMSASISHEIKNVLAIINENAGLLEDFALMAKKGRPIEMDRFMAVAGKIKKQVARADGIVKNLNRFAHSADYFSDEIDLNETLSFVVTLSERLAGMADASLEHREPDRQVPLKTTTFFLQNLLWLCLSFAMEAADGDKKINLLAEKTENGARIIFSNLTGMDKVSEDPFHSNEQKALLNALRAQLSIIKDEGKLILEVPDYVEG